MRFAVCVLFLLCGALVVSPVCGDDVLFIGNSFTFAAQSPVVELHGGVPKLVEAMAHARGHDLDTQKVTKPGMNWAYHLAQPATALALAAKPWTWVVLQDESREPTHVGNIPAFMRDGETFSDRIAAANQHAGIILYETWARPAGMFYWRVFSNGFSGPEQMMAELRESYAKLRDDLAARDPQREVRVAPVGTAFARATAETHINVNAADAHHASTEGYYLAALVIYATIYHESVKGAPVEFYDGALQIPADDAATLQSIADETVNAPVK